MLKYISTSSRTFFSILFIALLTALASEISIMPFNFSFRFGFGPIIFFLALLIKPVPIIRAGITTGIIITLFRSFLDVLLNNDDFSQILFTHIPAGIFYIVFAFCFSFIKIERVRLRPMTLGLYGVLFEIVSNCVESLTLYILIQETLTFQQFGLIIIVAFLRSFFIVGFYNAITISEQKKQLQQLLSIGSGLYIETLYLQKSMQQIEQLTAQSFNLYKHLKTIDRTLSLEALSISQGIHELKKDSERIYAGLSKITTTDQHLTFLLSELLFYITEANEKYSSYLQKDITFQTTFNIDFKIHGYFTMLALINNLVANAVEAISLNGVIGIHVYRTKETTIIIVEDNGVGIKEHEIPIIFDPGYTSKYNNNGKASTGIGLSHVQAIVSQLGGSITVTSNSATKFTISIPTDRLV